MLKYEKQALARQAQEFGFVRDTFEKICRLSAVLSFMQRDPMLGEKLALKGGTAINLTIFMLPRLSVDIDLDYVENNSRDEMLTERAEITDIIKRYMAAEGYELSSKSKTFYSLDSFVFVYMNSAGIHDNIKIELNYSLRCHILPLEHRRIETNGFLSASHILTVAPIEIFASKIVALLSRAAARDLYDINNMIYFKLFNAQQEEILRKCVVFYSAIGSQTVPEAFDLSRIDSLTKYKIKTDLNPVIKRKETFDLVATQTLVKSYLAKLLVLTDSEHEFLNAFRNKKYRPELLFENEIQERIKKHPMALWKCRE